MTAYQFKKAQPKLGLTNAKWQNCCRMRKMDNPLTPYPLQREKMLMTDNRRTYRMQPLTLSQIKELRRKLGIDSDARVIALAIDRLAQRELNQGGNK